MTLKDLEKNFDEFEKLKKELSLKNKELNDACKEYLKSNALPIGTKVRLKGTNMVWTIHQFEFDQFEKKYVIK